VKSNYATYQAKDPGQAGFALKMEAAASVMRKRLESLGLTDAAITIFGADKSKIEVDIPAAENPGDAFTALGKSAKLEFLDPNGSVILTGDNIAGASYASSYGNNAINITLDGNGADTLAKATARLVGQAINIQLDGKIISTPLVAAPITGGKVNITGGFTVEEARFLAAELDSGPLPLDFEIVDSGEAMMQ
jgi:preprotein translocase subunit SecD